MQDQNQGQLVLVSVLGSDQDWLCLSLHQSTYFETWIRVSEHNFFQKNRRRLSIILVAIYKTQMKTRGTSFSTEVDQFIAREKEIA